MRNPRESGCDAASWIAGVHETYERLAPRYGYQTRPETRTFDPNTPNGRLMLAVAATVMQKLGLRSFDQNKRGRCQQCGSRRPFYLVKSNNDHVCGTLEICLDCGHVQGQWPYPFQQPQQPQ